MIDSVDDLDLKVLDDIKEPADVLKKLDEILTEKLGHSLEDIKKPLLEYVKSHAEELALELPNIAPFGDYGKLLEDNDGMANFLKTDCAEPKHWLVYLISGDDKFDQLIRVVFKCLAVDDGEALKGTVFVSKAGVIRHAFAQTV